jgi:hypothetical protein
MKLTPTDLERELDTRGYKEDAVITNNHGQGLAGFLAIAEELEHDLFFVDGSARREWLHLFRQFQYTMKFWASGGESRLGVAGLSALVDLAKKNWRGPMGSKMKAMPFIANAELCAIAERDYASMLSSLKQEEWKAALVLAGCVVEAALADALDRQAAPARTTAAQQVSAAGKKKNPRAWPASFDAADPARWTFHQMIEICGPTPGLDLLGERTVTAAHSVRDFRNYVHPREEAKTLTAEPLAEPDARLAFALVEAILTDLS